MKESTIIPLKPEPLIRQVSDPSMVTEMSLRTGLNEEDCHFYLESMNWDLDAAIEMWEGLRKVT